MLSRFLSLRFIADNVSKVITTRATTTPVSNLLIHTSACQKGKDGDSTRRPLLVANEPLGPDPYQYEKPEIKFPSVRVAVILSGFGALDGSDPFETISLITHMHEHGIVPDFFARDGWTDSVDNMFKKMDRRHNMVESGRMLYSRAIINIRFLNPEDYAGLIIPGGNGIGSSLSLYNERLHNAYVNGYVYHAIQGFRRKRKPIATVGNAGLLLPVPLPRVMITVGTMDARAARALGAQVVMTHVMDVTHDKHHNVFSTPGTRKAGSSPNTVFEGMGNLITRMREPLKRIYYPLIPNIQGRENREESEDMEDVEEVVEEGQEVPNEEEDMPPVPPVPPYQPPA